MIWYLPHQDESQFSEITRSFMVIRVEIANIMANVLSSCFLMCFKQKSHIDPLVSASATLYWLNPLSLSLRISDFSNFHCQASKTLILNLNFKFFILIHAENLSFYLTPAQSNWRLKSPIERVCFMFDSAAYQNMGFPKLFITVDSVLLGSSVSNILHN